MCMNWFLAIYLDFSQMIKQTPTIAGLQQLSSYGQQDQPKGHIIVISTCTVFVFTWYF